MNTVTVSPKFQVVISKQVRNQNKVQIGMKFEVITYGDRIELIPIKPIKVLKGTLKGINTVINRT